MSKVSTNKREYRKAFGQLASTQTQRIDNLKPLEIELDTQEDVAGGIHTIDFDKSDIIVKQSGMYLIIAAPQIGKAIRVQAVVAVDGWVRVRVCCMLRINKSKIQTRENGFTRQRCQFHFDVVIFAIKWRRFSRHNGVLAQLQMKYPGT